MTDEKQLIDIYKTKTLLVYLHELFYLCDGIRRECEEIFKESKVPEKGYVITVSPVLHSRINSVLIYAANIKKLISTPKHKSKKESRKMYQLRKQREKLFNVLLIDLEITEINESKVRNTLEHFEEYLDEFNLDLEKENNKIIKDYSTAAYNMTFSEWNAIHPKVYPVRLYIAKEKKLYNFNWSVNIGDIYDEALSIIKRLKSLKQFESDDSTGGIMLNLNS